MTKPQRNAKGHWLPGISANPGGRSTDSYILQEAAKQHGPKAVETLAALMVDKKQSGAVRMGAACALLDRGFGRPQVSIEAKIETVDFSAMHLNALRDLANLKTEESIIDVTPSSR